MYQVTLFITEMLLLEVKYALYLGAAEQAEPASRCTALEHG